jgi:hypothetical protein
MSALVWVIIGITIGGIVAVIAIEAALRDTFKGLWK